MNERKFWKVINKLNWRIIRLENHIIDLEDIIVELKVKDSLNERKLQNIKKEG